MRDVEQTDGELAARALAGDDAAFATLVGRHKNWAYHFIQRYVGNPADAYDVLQDTFFSAWRALARYQKDLPFEFWLRRIALNKCRDRNRRERVRRFIGVAADDDSTELIGDTAPGPAELAESAQQLQLIERQVRRLPRALKEALLLTAYEGLSHAEAGSILGISAKAVETKVYRARTQLAKMAQQVRADTP